MIKIEKEKGCSIECDECKNKAEYTIFFTRTEELMLCEKHMKMLKTKIMFALGDFRSEQDTN